MENSAHQQGRGNANNSENGTNSKEDDKTLQTLNEVVSKLTETDCLDTQKQKQKSGVNDQSSTSSSELPQKKTASPKNSSNSKITAASDSSSSDSSDTEASPVTETLSDTETEEEYSVITNKQKNNGYTQEEELYFHGVPIPNLSTMELEDNLEFQHSGDIFGFWDDFVLVQSLPDLPRYDIRTPLFIDDQRTPLGLIIELVGDVNKPVYVVKNSKEELQKLNLERGQKVYSVPLSKYTNYVLVSDLLKLKGTDASWTNDNEVPPEFQDFSDDEKENIAKFGLPTPNFGKRSASLSEASGEQPESPNVQINQQPREQQQGGSNRNYNNKRNKNKNLNNKRYDNGRRGNMNNFSSNTRPNNVSSFNTSYGQPGWNYPPRAQMVHGNKPEQAVMINIDTSVPPPNIFAQGHNPSPSLPCNSRCIPPLQCAQMPPSGYNLYPPPPLRVPTPLCSPSSNRTLVLSSTPYQHPTSSMTQPVYFNSAHIYIPAPHTMPMYSDIGPHSMSAVGMQPGTQVSYGSSQYSRGQTENVSSLGESNYSTQSMSEIYPIHEQQIINARTQMYIGNPTLNHNNGQIIGPVYNSGYPMHHINQLNIGQQRVNHPNNQLRAEAVPFAPNNSPQENCVYFPNTNVEY